MVKSYNLHLHFKITNKTKMELTIKNGNMEMRILKSKIGKIYMELEGTIWIKIFHSTFSKCHRRKTRMPNQELKGGSESLTCGQIPSSNKKEKRWLVVEIMFCTCHNLKKLKNIYVSTMCHNFGLSLLFKNHLFSGNIYIIAQR